MLNIAKNKLFVIITVAYILANLPLVSAQSSGQSSYKEVSGNGQNAAIYVANQASNNISVVDAVSFNIIETISVGDRPHNVNHTPDGHYVLVTNKNVNIPKPPSL